MRLPALFLLFGALATGRGPGIGDFTDSDFQRALKENSRILFYSVSPGMPLSVEGLKEIQGASDDLHAKLVVLLDPSVPEADVPQLSGMAVLFQKSSRLRDAGLQLHYPSVLVSANHKVAGPPIAGYKSRSGYVTLISDLLKLKWTENFTLADRLPLSLMRTSYFKPVSGTDLIQTGGPQPRLFNVSTGNSYTVELRLTGDPGPTPDGDFVTLLRFDGLSWYRVNDILTGKARIVFHDPGLRTYQSLGQLTPSAYRVLGAVSSSTRPAGLIFRDYERRADESGNFSIAPQSPWNAVCGGKTIALPMISKTGLYLSGIYEGTMHVFRIGRDGKECTPVFDAKVNSGKADFSADDRFLLYVARSQNPAAATVDTVFLADLQKKKPSAIFHAEGNHQIVFPAFLTGDRIVLHDQTDQELLILERTRVILK